MAHKANIVFLEANTIRRGCGGGQAHPNVNSATLCWAPVSGSAP